MGLPFFQKVRFFLKKFGFGPKFVSWIRALYSSPMAAVCTNNNLSSYFKLQRGTRQGCPLSPLLFAIAIEPLALAIRQDSSIKGIDRGGLECKISLYADDLLLYISDPLLSLPQLLGTLENFGKISGYKINLQKSELMPINVSADNIALSSTPFKINTKKFKYLGIWVTHNYKDLFKANLLPLLDGLKQDIKRWDLLPLSLSGRINTIKMNVLPKFLYLFQNLPIFLTKFFFSSIDKLISTFIWNKKNPRIRKCILRRTRPQGGMALPNFLFYYWAANIRALMFWMSDVDNSNIPNWLILERTSCGPSSLSALLCTVLPLAKPISYYTHNPVVTHSIKIWIQFRRSFTLNSLSLFAPITKNHMFPPSVLDGAFGVWSRNGIHSLQDLYVDNNFASFEQLVDRFNIPRSHFFRYLQLRNFIASNFSCFPLCPRGSLLDSIFKLGKNSKQIIGKIYGLLNLFNLSTLDYLKHKWEEDLNEQIPDAVWQKIIRRIHTSSICQRHTVVQFKIVHRLHWSKVRLSKIRPELNPICDRCKQDPATLLHMFWTCPKLLHFWQSIFKTFSKILMEPIDPSPLSALFGVTPQAVNLSSSKSNVVAFCTLLARRLILFRWKDPFPPTYSHWIREIMEYLKLEKIRYSLQGSVLKFYATWQPFLTFVDQMEAENVTL